MKDQYFGDVGDYGKYGLLRHLSKNEIRIAVNWYLTKNDGTKHGKHIEYLQKEEEYSKYDQELFSILNGMMPPGSEIRDVKQFELKDAIPSAIYYHEKLNMRDQPTSEKRREHRDEWHKNALAACSGAELVFLDPDNGIVVKPRSLRTAEKYAYAEEIEKYYERGQDVVYYCHKGRRKPDKWEEYKLLMKICLPEAALMGLTFHRGTQRSYIFVCHPERAERYRSLLKAFLATEWGSDEKRPVFTEEWTEGFIRIQNTE